MHPVTSIVLIFCILGGLFSATSGDFWPIILGAVFSTTLLVIEFLDGLFVAGNAMREWQELNNALKRKELARLESEPAGE